MTIGCKTVGVQTFYFLYKIVKDISRNWNIQRYNYLSMGYLINTICCYETIEFD